MSLSLRHRLLLLLIPAIVCVWLVTAFTAAWQTYQQAQAVLDANLAQSASVVLSLVGHEMNEHRLAGVTLPAVAPAPWAEEIRGHLETHTLDTPLSFQVSSGDGALAFRSPGAPDTPLSDGRSGFSSLETTDRAWRVYTLNDPVLAVIVRVAELHEHRSRLLAGILTKMLLPLLVGVPLLTLLIWMSVGRGLRPLQQITRQVERRDPFHLEPLSIQHPPRDLDLLVSALDRLFVRLEKALDGERCFTADAAHELRTPLAGIRAQAQVALNATTEHARRRALGQLLAAVDRAARLISQLLTLARLDAEKPQPPSRLRLRCADLSRLAGEVLADLAEDAARKDLRVSLDAAKTANISLGEDAAQMMLRNLVDNAIRYTPDSGSVQVTITRDPETIGLEVADSGPGVAVLEREHILRRFHRGPHPDTPGTGLGLSIVARIVELAHGQIRLADSDLGGLSVSVRLPASAPQDAHHTEVCRS